MNLDRILIIKKHNKKILNIPNYLKYKILKIRK